MIDLSIQIKSILVSFLFGMFLKLIISMNYKFLFHTKGIIKVLGNLFFVIDLVFIYFLILRYVNDGIMHYYFIIFIVLGFLLMCKIQLIFKKFK